MGEPGIAAKSACEASGTGLYELSRTSASDRCSLRRPTVDEADEEPACNGRAARRAHVVNDERDGPEVRPEDRPPMVDRRAIQLQLEVIAPKSRSRSASRTTSMDIQVIVIIATTPPGAVKSVSPEHEAP